MEACYTLFTFSLNFDNLTMGVITTQHAKNNNFEAVYKLRSKICS